MKTIELMKEGRFIGPTKGNDSDCLTVGEYDGIYIIEMVIIEHVVRKHLVSL